MNEKMQKKNEVEKPTTTTLYNNHTQETIACPDYEMHEIFILHENQN